MQTTIKAIEIIEGIEKTLMMLEREMETKIT
jgi:hypothetical protein